MQILRSAAKSLVRRMRSSSLSRNLSGVGAKIEAYEAKPLALRLKKLNLSGILMLWIGTQTEVWTPSAGA